MKGKTRKEVAKMFNVSEGTINRWEREGKTPKPTKIRHNQEVRYSDEVIAAIHKFVTEEEPSRPARSVAAAVSAEAIAR